jgi:hypothetical protein
MTLMDITLHYLAPVGPRQLRAIYRVPEVYGIRRLSLDEISHSILVEYDASRLHPEDVRALLRSAGLDTDDVAEGVFDAG